jgi:aspartyl-tRNA(Asn)/glutamyl-tRNA(Gln) amidotransferase subunit A
MRGIAEIAAGYRDGSLTPTEVAELAQDRIAVRNPVLNAFADPMRDSAMSQAGELERMLARGDDLGPLHGIPVAIKDLIDVSGAPTACGTKVVPPRIAERDATLVARLRKAGAIILGKTQLLEYAYGIAHPEVGQTNNPVDPTRTAGGSSGGSAAVVADGIVPAAIGTDTGGSIRIPAAYCGIVGVKPSFGRVPLDGVFPLSQSLDHAGPLTRSVTDAALVLSCIAAIPLPLDDPGAIRIGVLRQHFPRDSANAAVGDVIEAALRKLSASGCGVVDLTIPELDAANRCLIDILLPEAALIHAEMSRRNPGGYAPETLAQIRAGEAVSATCYLSALRDQAMIRAATEAVFGRCDVLLSPAVPFVAPHEDPKIDDHGDSEMTSSGFANLTGHPSLVLPAGQVDNLPVGLQLTGRLGADRQLLSYALQIETLLLN